MTNLYLAEIKPGSDPKISMALGYRYLGLNFEQNDNAAAAYYQKAALHSVENFKSSYGLLHKFKVELPLDMIEP